jgi:hypothetical protein
MAVRHLDEPIEPTVLVWEDFQIMFHSKHKQGEHVSIVGQTGSGKTVLGLEICKLIGAKKTHDGRPSRVVVLATKPQDDTVEALHWPVIKKWPPGFGEEHCIVWPKGGPPSQASRTHRAVFYPLLDTIYSEGGQTVFIGEAAYFERPLPNGLGMGATMEHYWTTARSLKLSLVADTQRPRNVTRSMWSEPSWVFIFPPDDEDDLKRVAELSGMKWDVINSTRRLQGFEFLCVRRQRGSSKELYVSRVER